VPFGVSDLHAQGSEELRIASAVVKALRSRAAARCFSSSLIKASTTAVS
jgi:hypothetical protein